MADCLFAKNATRCYQILSFIRLPIVIILLGVVIHLGISNSKSDDSPDSGSQEFISEHYDGFFRTPDEQAELKRKFFTHHGQFETVCSTDDLVTTFTQLIMTASNPKTTKSNVKHHACCESEVTWITPDSAIDMDGNNVTLVQYKGRRQYFQSETCCQEDGCEIPCTCHQDCNTPNALIYNPVDGRPRVLVRLIYVPGCCKCLNMT